MLVCGERLDRSSVWVLGVTWGKGEERSEKGRRLNLFPLSPPSSKIYSPLTPKEGPILCLLRLENFRNMRLSPDPQVFSAPDLKPAVGKIQNRCQWKHIIIHESIIWSDLRATCARVWGSGRERSLPYLTSISKAGRLHPGYHSAIPWPLLPSLRENRKIHSYWKSAFVKKLMSQISGIKKIAWLLTRKSTKL